LRRDAARAQYRKAASAEWMTGLSNAHPWLCCLGAMMLVIVIIFFFVRQ
jgi:hypothetical protein